MRIVVLLLIALTAVSDEPWKWPVLALLAVGLMLLMAWDRDKADARVASLEKELGYTRRSGVTIHSIIAAHRKEPEKRQGSRL